MSGPAQQSPGTGSKPAESGGSGQASSAGADIQSLLPPGASTSGSSGPSSNAASLLPPGTGNPAASQPIAAASGHTPTSDDTGLLRLREPVKTIGHGDDEIELRKLTPEEKARKRFKKNLILWGFGIVMLVVTMVILLTLGPVSR